MKYSPEAIATLRFGGVGIGKRQSGTLYAVCAEKNCHRVRTFRGREEAEAAGWHIGRSHNLCPKCAGQRRSE
jgi:hypothetical protein